MGLGLESISVCLCCIAIEMRILCHVIEIRVLTLWNLDRAGQWNASTVEPRLSGHLGSRDRPDN